MRDAVRAECAAAGAPAPPDIMVVSLFAGGGHDPGSGPLPAGLPIEIDLWPRDEASGCWADMTRTFVGGGEVTDEVAELRDIAREALEAARARRAPGRHRPRALRRRLRRRRARRLPDPAHPRAGRGRSTTASTSASATASASRSTSPRGSASPATTSSSRATSSRSSPGIEGIEGIGGVRFEDLLLITEDGSETLTDYPYDLVRSR